MKAIVLFFLFPFVASAQPIEWQILEKDFETGDTVYAEFRCYNFTGIGAFQFCLKADTAKADFLLVESFNAHEQEEKLPEGVNPVYTETQKQLLLGADTSGGKTPQNSLVIFSPLEFTGNLPGLDDGDFSWHGKPGYNLPAGQLRSVWSNPYGSTVADGLVIFKIRLKAKQAGSLSQCLNLWPNHPLKPICYKAIPLTYMGQMPFVYVAEQEQTTATEQADAQEWRVWPNPFTDTFNVEIPAGITAVRMYDANSRLLWEMATGQCLKGETLKINTLRGEGMYFIEARDREGAKYVKQLFKN